jgi:uncharacterized protein with von Willebrand factor type A (vWA) domain
VAFAAESGVPDFVAARDHLRTELIRFVRTLREEGVSVPASGALSAARALAAVGLDERARVSAALRASLLSEPTDADAFEAAFPAFWRRLRRGFEDLADDGETAGSDPDERAPTANATDGSEPPPESDPPAADDEGDPASLSIERRRATGDGSADSGRSDRRRYGATGRREPIGDAIGRPDDDALDAIDRFVDALSTRPGRRRRRSERGSGVDARSALRESLQTGGAPLSLPHTAAVRSELQCCLLIDISGSVLDTIDRGALLAFAERFVSRAWNARVFFFDTELREVTETFTRAGGDPAAALRAAEIEWGGGTEIGRAIGTLRRTAPHAADRRTAVVVVSDGLDVGDPARLADGIAWLADRARGIVWLNPLAVSPDFEPTSRGMATVAPYLDALFGFAGASDLADPARQLRRRGLSGRVGLDTSPDPGREGRRSDAATDGGPTR